MSPVSRVMIRSSVCVAIMAGAMQLGAQEPGAATSEPTAPPVATTPPAADPAPAITPTFGALPFRSIGPTTAGGRITDLAIDPRDSATFYVASASGGLWKTVNRGTTFTPVFDREGSSSIGAVAVAPSEPDTVFVGTGEGNPRNSVSWGDGVYKSTDGGKTWTNVGLRETRNIGEIAIHPADPRVVFVAAMGRTWGDNLERGLYRTKDGGETWQPVLQVDGKTGCIDVVIDPRNHDTVYAATWERRRDATDEGDPKLNTGAGSGLWRSLDGGNSFTRLENGLPTRPLGRIGIDVYAGDPNIVYAIIATDQTGQQGGARRSTDQASLGVRGKNAAGGFEIVGLTKDGPAELAGLAVGDVIIRVGGDAVIDAKSLGLAMERFKPGEAVEVAYQRAGAESTVRVELFGRMLGAGRDMGAGMQGGQVANAQDEQGRGGLETGGVFRSDDGGANWTRINSLIPRPFYYGRIRIDPSDASRVYVLGISFHRSNDGGKTFDTRGGAGTHPDHHALWIDPSDPDHLLLGNDGGLYQTWDRCATWDFLDHLPFSQFYGVAVDDRVPYNVAGGLQDNGTWYGPSRSRRPSGVITEDWVTVNGGDGFQAAFDPEDSNVLYCESQNGAIARVNLATGERRGVSKPNGDEHRWQWDTPFLISPHNPKTLLYAGTHVIRSVDRGDSHKIISTNIARTDWGSATALAWSARDEDRMYVGADDGALWTTGDGGKTWESIQDKLGIPQPMYVSSIEASRHERNRVYVTIDGHRDDDTAPYVFVSDDAGKTFTRLGANLPDGSLHCVAEDLRNPDLLFVGSEFGCFVSLDRGKSFLAFRENLPTVAVHDLVIHPRERELVAATHGRGIYIADIAPLQDLAGKDLAKEARLPPVATVIRLDDGFDSSGYGSRRYVARNPASVTAIYLWSPTEFATAPKFEIRDPAGEVLRTIEGGKTAGLQRVAWDHRIEASSGRPARFAAAGDYGVTLTLGESILRSNIRVEDDPHSD
jgi:photosystem II stability/assembly factor-like uncharacterized protein